MAIATPGRRYKHKKGGTYTVLHIAEHTERDETLVIYQHSTGSIHARPRDNWEDPGRFVEIEPEDL